MRDVRRSSVLALAALVVIVAAIAPGAAAAAAPVPVVTVDASIRVVGEAASRGCPNLRRACTLTTTDAARLEIRVEPAGALAGASLVVTRRQRAPGADAALASRSPVRGVVLGPDRLAALVDLDQVVTGAGTWCIQPIVARSGLDPVRGDTTCVRLRPPVELGWAGDTVIGSSWGMPPMGGVAQLAQVHDLLRAPDLMIGNYEGTLSRGGRPRCGGGPPCYIFQAPPERARNLATAGFDVMTLANNHALDMGSDARRQTVAALDAVGVRHAGLPGQVAIEQVADTRVAIVGFSPYPGTTSMRDLDAIRALVRAATRQGDVVVATFHAGLEGPGGAHVPRGYDAGTPTRAAVHAAVDAGADVVFGSGPHVVRGVERYRGAFIVYSSGNFAGWNNFALDGLREQSGVVRVSLDFRGRTRSAAWDGVVIERPGIPRPDRSGRVIARVASLSRADFGRAGARFARDGGFR
jgi:hypothetical protein